jgi:FAD/FMN-containing dehydrogenase
MSLSIHTTSRLSARELRWLVLAASPPVAGYVFSTYILGQRVSNWLTTFQYSFHSNSHGFACDNVVNWEIVLADGSVVNANASTNPDLWKAQKGGSGNLGFVTRIDQRKQLSLSSIKTKMMGYTAG